MFPARLSKEVSNPPSAESDRIFSDLISLFSTRHADKSVLLWDATFSIGAAFISSTSQWVKKFWVTCSVLCDLSRSSSYSLVSVSMSSSTLSAFSLSWSSNAYIHPFITCTSCTTVLFKARGLWYKDSLGGSTDPLRWSISCPLVEGFEGEEDRTAERCGEFCRYTGLSKSKLPGHNTSSVQSTKYLFPT